MALDAVYIDHGLIVEQFYLGHISSVCGIVAEALRVRGGHCTGKRNQFIKRNITLLVAVNRHSISAGSTGTLCPCGCTDKEIRAVLLCNVVL